ncbi:MAG: ABC transporter permease [Chloroflexi bacterium]|nr:ABC transporter permease [Chloroflexota bacterium]
MRGPSPELRVIFAEEFRRQIRGFGFAFFTVLIPVLMLIAIPITPVVVDLVEGDDSEGVPVVTGAPLERIGYADPAGVLPVREPQAASRRYGDLAAGIEAVRQGEIDAFFVLPSSYIESGVVEHYRASGESRGRFWGNAAAEFAFRSFLTGELIAGQVEPSILARALHPADYRNFEIGADGAVAEAIPLAQEIGELLVPTLLAALLLIGVLSGSGALMRSVAEEKETRMIEMLVTSAAPLSIMSGKLLALGLAGLIQIAVWIAVATFTMPAIFDRIPNGGDLTISAGLLTTVSLSFVLGYFLFSVLALFIASVVSSSADAQKYTGLLSLLTALPIWLAGLFISQPDGAVAQILSYFPFTAPTTLMVRLGAGSDMSEGEIALALGITAGTALVLLWVASRVFRAGILLSGQRITGRNVWAALWHAQ